MLSHYIHIVQSTNCSYLHKMLKTLQEGCNVFEPCVKNGIHHVVIPNLILCKQWGTDRSRDHWNCWFSGHVFLFSLFHWSVTFTTGHCFYPLFYWPLFSGPHSRLPYSCISVYVAIKVYVTCVFVAVQLWVWVVVLLSKIYTVTMYIGLWRVLQATLHFGNHTGHLQVITHENRLRKMPYSFHSFIVNLKYLEKIAVLVFQLVLLGYCS